MHEGLWRNGSASDSRSEGWEFESLWPHFAESHICCQRFSNNEKLKVRRIISFRARQEITSKVSCLVISNGRLNHVQCMIRCSIVVSISACHAEDPGSIPGGGVFAKFKQTRAVRVGVGTPIQL